MDNTVLIVLDTLRKDYGDKYIWPVLEKYGFKKYDNAIAPAPWTTPTHVSMFTGMYPLYHGVHLRKERIEIGKVRLTPEITETVKESIGSTFAVSANLFLSRAFGFPWKEERIVEKMPSKVRIANVRDHKRVVELSNEGIPHRATVFIKEMLRRGYIDSLVRIGLHKAVNGLRALLSEWPKDKGAKDIARIVDGIDASQYDTIFVNLMEVHEPYTKFVGAYIMPHNPELVHRKYREFTKYLAKYVGSIIESLEKKGVERIIVVADHGQMLGEHGAYGHTWWMYDELLRVPMYIKGIEVVNGDWISLTDVRNALNRGKIAGGTYALADSFAMKDKDYRNMPKYRIAVYYKDYKGIFNVDDWKWESWKTYDGSEDVPENARKEMQKIVLRHLKGALAAKGVKG